jgi:hypothetical protein
MSIAEAQGAGVGVCMANIRPDLREYVGPAGFFVRLNPDSAVETSWGRMWGWNRREKRDRGNDIVGMSCRLIRYGPFQLRRNWKSL